MNPTRKLLALVAAFAGLSSLGSAAVVYSEAFPNAASPDKAVSSIGWSLVTQLDNTASIATSTTAHGVVAFAAGSDGAGGFIYTGPGKNGGTRVFTETGLNTTTYPGLTFDNLGTISFDAAANNNAITLRLIVQANASTWYISNQIFTINTNGTFAAASTAGNLSYSLDATSATWSTVSFATGSPLSISAATLSLDGATGSFTGIGFIVKNDHATNGSVVRIDNLVVSSAIPEPSSAAALAGALALGAVAVRRRRRSVR